jgi:signal transduction histidine kinase
MAMGIAHEIRNPMASIRGCVQELSRLSRGDERQRRYMQIVCQESDRLDRVMEGFLHYARSGPPDLVPLDFVPVIDEALVLLRSRPEFGARRLVWDPPPERPRIFGDRNRLVQLLLNLGLNAIDATSPTTGEVRLILRARSSVIPGRGWKEAPVAGVELEFGDNGSGMSKESLEKLFMPFFTTKPSGTGLGMCIVERIVREHMGSLDIQSLPGEGSVIRIWLPALAAATPGGAAQEVRSAAEEKEPGVVVS